MMSRCVFESSKHYRVAHADPDEIVEPLGDKFINVATSSNAPKFSSRRGELVIKHIYDKNNHQILSQRRTIFERL